MASMPDPPPIVHCGLDPVGDAESIVARERLALKLLATLTVGQLRGLVWVGLLDEGWTRVYDEVASRGVSW